TYMVKLCPEDVFIGPKTLNGGHLWWSDDDCNSLGPTRLYCCIYSFPTPCSVLTLRPVCLSCALDML
ncbi:hypothetical protein STEG23_013190, partial [Scotinomys teguina]